MTGRWRGISLQHFALAALPLTVILLVIAFVGQIFHEQAIQTLVGQRDERAARAAAGAISNQLNFHGAEIQSLALRAAGGERAQSLLSQANLPAEDLEGLAIIAPDGTLLAATPNAEVWEKYLALAGWPEEPRAQATGPDPWFMPLFQANGAGPSILLVAARGGDGLTAVGAVKPAEIARRALAEVLLADEETYAFIVDNQNQVIFQMGQPPAIETESPPHPGVSEALSGQSGAAYVSDFEKEHVVAYSPISPLNWALVLEQPWQGLLDPWLRLTELAPLLLAPALVITMVAVWFAAYQVVRPINTLQRKATQLAWGDFQAIEEPVGGIAEIRRLQKELIHLAHKVEAAQKGLRSYLRAVTQGQEEERLRLARELHDDTLQSLVALNQRVQLTRLELDGHPASAQLEEVGQISLQLVSDLRRVTRALRPTYLEELGLVPALETLAKDGQKGAGIPVSFQVSGRQRRLSSEVELALYRVAQEALTNAVRHAQSSCVSLALDYPPGKVRLTIKDDGRGFKVPESPADLALAGHFGLLGLHERAELIGGRLKIDSAPDDGTEISISIST